MVGSATRYIFIYLNRIALRPLAGRSTSPKSDSPRKLPLMASANSPVFPLVRVIASDGKPESALGFTSICLMLSNLTLTVPVPFFTGT
jgi:hypothetical protein